MTRRWRDREGGGDPLVRAVGACVAVSAAVVAGVVLSFEPARAAEPGLPADRPARSAAFPQADLALGERLIREHRCRECHASQVGGDGSDIHDPGGRVDTPARLLAAVQGCATKLGLPLFPEDVEAVAAVLDRDHYHFAVRP